MSAPSMHTIEYIGPRPQKPSRNPWGGGWLMVFLVVVGVSIAAWPFITPLLAGENKITDLKIEKTVAWLENTPDFNRRLAAAALERTKEKITYDPAYYKIPYPMGDVPEGKGVCSDVIVRSYRTLGIDLQALVHEDMVSNFRIYPQIWGLKAPDTNIDHRRVPNLQRFFSRHGEELPLSENPTSQDFSYGDIVAWRLPHGATHIGIVVPGPSDQKDEKWIVHNIGSGPQWEDKLFEYKLIGHYRYTGKK